MYEPLDAAMETKNGSQANTNRIPTLRNYTRIYEVCAGRTSPGRSHEKAMDKMLADSRPSCRIAIAKLWTRMRKR